MKEREGTSERGAMPRESGGRAGKRETVEMLLTLLEHI